MFQIPAAVQPTLLGVNTVTNIIYVADGQRRRFTATFR
jgi:hypothetical protein